MSRKRHVECAATGASGEPGGVEVIDRTTGATVVTAHGIEEQFVAAILGFATTLQAQKDGKKPKQPTWVALVEVATRELLGDDDVTDAEVRVWTGFVVNLDFGGRLKVTQQQLASDINVSRRVVSRAFAKLQKLGMIEKVKPLPGTTLCWRVKSTAAKKGHRSIPEAKELARQARIVSIAQAREAGDDAANASAA